MPTLSLTDRRVAALAPTTRTDYFDAALPGFGVRVSPSGRKVWFLTYRAARHRRRLPLGRYGVVSLADAREAAQAAIRPVDKGEDPTVARQEARGRTFEALAELYVEKHAKRFKRSWREDDGMIRRELLPRWRDRNVTTLRRADVRELLDDIVARGAPVLANRMLALVRKMLNFALDREWVEVNPAMRMARPAKEHARARVLTADEIRRVWTYLAGTAPDDAHAELRANWATIRTTFQLRFVTAQRLKEVLAMRWMDVDLESSGCWWTVPGDIAKNGLAHRVWLTDEALAVLRTLRAAAEPVDAGAFVFAGARGKRQRSGGLQVPGVGDLQPRDLRRTAASYMTSAGIPRLSVAKVLNHVERGITAVYDRHSYDPEKKAALESWASTLGRLIAEPRVVAFPTR